MHMKHVGHAKVRHTLSPARALRVGSNAPVAFLHPQRWAVGRAVIGIFMRLVDKANVCRIQGILQVLEVVAAARIGIDLEQAFKLFELWKARRRRWLPVSQVGKDEPEIILDRVRANPHLGREGLWLGGLLDTLAGTVVFPAVVKAADAVSLYPAGGQLRTAVRAAEGRQ